MGAVPIAYSVDKLVITPLGSVPGEGGCKKSEKYWLDLVLNMSIFYFKNYSNPIYQYDLYSVHSRIIS